ncbi:MAG: spore coat associated protein CotJA [Chloroflexota bacterium]
MSQRQHIGPYPLAHAFVPFQCYVTRFPPLEGLKAGTIFPELVSQYVPRVCAREGE